MYLSLWLATFWKCCEMIFESAFSLPFRIMVRLWHSVVIILLFTKATQAERTGYLFWNPRQLSSLDYFHLNRFMFKSFLFSLSLTVYTFEDASHLSAFTASSPSTLKLTTTRYKDAKHSMKWTWTSGATITHSFTSNVSTLFT